MNRKAQYIVNRNAKLYYILVPYSPKCSFDTLILLGKGTHTKMEIRVSVRQLVEFILREGNIDNRRTGGADTAMQEGSRIHRMIQRSKGSEYHAEVSLKHIVNTTDYDIVIEGRADGIIDYEWEIRKDADYIDEKEVSTLLSNLNQNKVVIDEIKGTYKDLNRIKKPVGVHLAQAKCYAYIYATMYDLPEIGVRMTYCNLETEEIKYFHEDYTYNELATWFNELIAEYKKWTDFIFEWSDIRTTTIKELEFPFPYREGQRDLVKYVYHTIYHRRKLFLEAPTGVGKTISTVFPTVKAMGEGKIEKIFYLTAKTITRTVAQECFSLLCDNGLRMKSVVITAKEKICFLKEAEMEVACNPEACPYAKGHFDRINDAMYDLLTSRDDFTRESIVEYAKKHNVCPFEMALDMSLFSDAVICDYNYVFDPRVYLKRFFSDGMAKRDYAFLVDESHNLLERGREMYSASLFKGDFLAVKKLLKDTSKKITRLLEKCNKELLSMKRQCETYRKEESIDSFVMVLNRTYAAIDDFLDEHDTFDNRDEVLELYFQIAHFLNIYEIMDLNYVIYTQFMDDGDFMIKLFCVDPSTNLKQCMEKGRSSILFSATLLPIQYYKRLLGGESTDYEVYAKSTFDENKRALFIANDVTSKYTRRGVDEYSRIARYIYNIVNEKYGNYMVFLPSHNFLENVYNIFMDEYYDGRIMECIVQQEYMSEEKREEFLVKFLGNTDCDLHKNIDFDIEEDEENILIGFCVMGGIFSEGIDLKHDSLIGAIIVGTGIPQVGCERELLKEYFDQNGENGFDYAYRYPGMNKVLQSAGRVIRTADDVGVVALLDERFMEPQYMKMFPREWNKLEVVSVHEIAEKVKKFWDE